MGLFNSKRFWSGAREVGLSGLMLGGAAAAEYFSGGLSTSQSVSVAFLAGPLLGHGVSDMVRGTFEASNSALPNTPRTDLPSTIALGITGDIDKQSQFGFYFDTALLAATVTSYMPNGSIAQMPSKVEIANDVCGAADYFINSVDLFSSLNQSSSSIPQSNSAAGGFVLYPNKPNTNFMRSVYAK